MCIRDRTNIDQQDERITSFYCLHETLLFVKTSNNQRSWKLVIPKAMEKELILDYHIRYGHMGSLKVMKALEEHTYIKNINRRVRDYIRQCHICQLVKCNNDRKEGIMQPITSTSKLESVFLDICGPLPRSGGRRQYKFIIIIFDHYSKFTKLYPINRSTTKELLHVVTQQYIPEIGTLRSIITDHGTQFRGRKWKETLVDLGVKTYKTSVYHPNSNPAERVLREV